MNYYGQQPALNGQLLIKLRASKFQCDQITFLLFCLFSRKSQTSTELMYHRGGMDNHTFHDVVTKLYLEVFSKSGNKEEMEILRKF